MKKMHEILKTYSYWLVEDNTIAKPHFPFFLPPVLVSSILTEGIFGASPIC